MLTRGEIERRSLTPAPSMAIWGSLSAAETDLWNSHFNEFLELFCNEVHASGGPALDPAELERQVTLYTVLMGVTWLMDVPALVRSKTPHATRRTDASIKEVEGVRAPLQMLTNVLNLWSSRDVGEALRGL